jgi:hypothetical protein
MWAPYTYDLPAQRWLSLLHSGWATGWLMGLQRNANWLSQRPTRLGVSPLLRESVRNLKLRADAPWQPPKREGASLHYLKR